MIFFSVKEAKRTPPFRPPPPPNELEIANAALKVKYKCDVSKVIAFPHCKA
jgi:hypothetical protein